MKNVFVVFLAVVAGFIGGTISTHTRNVCAQQAGSGLVRATRFELTNETGQTLAFWGLDDRKNTVLAFGRRDNTMLGRASLPGRATDDMRTYKDELAAIGMYYYGTPFIELKGSDGESRAKLYMTEFEKPMLFLRDQNTTRVSLGIDPSDTHEASDDDWSLSFYPNNRAAIGMVVDPRQKHLTGHLWLNDKMVK